MSLGGDLRHRNAAEAPVSARKLVAATSMLLIAAAITVGCNAAYRTIGQTAAPTTSVALADSAAPAGGADRHVVEGVSGLGAAADPLSDDVVPCSGRWVNNGVNAGWVGRQVLGCHYRASGDR